MTHRLFVHAALVAVLAWAAAPACAADRPALVETPMFADAVAGDTLPAVAQRVPDAPRIVSFDGTDVSPGRHGGELRILMGRVKDVRMMVVYGYARLVGYGRDLELRPDLLERVDVDDGRIFTLHLRKGHKWSDGHPFTAEDFRYYWEDMATNEVIAPTGPPPQLIVDGEPATFEVVDESTVRYSWTKPNHFFLPALAGALPLFIYRPSHYLKRFHGDHAEPAALQRLVAEERQRDWRALHFMEDHPYKNDKPEMPSLQPWMNTTKSPAQRYIFVRNPFFHRIDAEGRQLPYIDKVNVAIASAKLIPAKAGAVESDLQARHLALGNYTFLKQGEKRNNYTVHLWQTAKGSHMALFPNLNIGDEQWRTLFRKADFRRALSMAIDRHEINQVIYFGLATENNNTVLPTSPLYKPEYGTKWTQYDPKAANKLLDGLGLRERDGDGIRLFSDGRPLEIIVETAGEETEQVDVLQLVTDAWRKIGIKLYTKPLQREVLRNRIFAGFTQMSVWSGLENGIPTPELSPRELAPTSQQQLQWPKWGQYVETKGRAGEPVDMELPKRLQDFDQEWRVTADRARRTEIWGEMLKIHADQVYTIGMICCVLQPVLVNNRLRNVPEKGIYNWDPGAFFGMYGPDTFWLTPDAG